MYSVQNQFDSAYVLCSQADGGPEVGNLQDKQYHRICYADEVQYGHRKKRHSENLGK